jgi:hypothetical protein
MHGMQADARVCPFCGEPPGPGVFCAACGRNLSAVDRLPTREAWEAGDRAAQAGVVEAGTPSAVAAGTPARPVAERCAEATAAFLAAMHAAGDPGTTELPVPSRSTLRRTPKVRGWILRPVDRDDDVSPRRYAPGLVLSTEGAFHRLDSELRGWGQRDFPQYHHTVSAAPVDPPADERLLGELDAALRAHTEASGEVRGA